MRFQLFKQRILIVSLILLSLLVTACGRSKSEDDKKEVSVIVAIPNSSEPYVGRDKIAGGNSNSNEFEGTAGSVFYKNYEGPPFLLREIRNARGDGYDRVAFEFDGPNIPNYHVEYVDKPVRQCASGEVVQVAGDGWLEIRFNPANAHTEEGQPTVAERERRLGLPVLKELEITCDFEAEVAVVLGVSSPNRYRVLNLTNPTRVVIDIKHQNR